MQCSKKTFSKKESRADSTVEKSLQIVEVKKADSSNKTTLVQSEQKNSDSIYQKKTTIKEYYATGDELDISYDERDTVKRTVKNPFNNWDKVLFREIEILESGNIAKAQLTETETQQNTNKSNTDSSSKAVSEKTGTSKVQTTTANNQTKITMFPWWLIIISAVVIGGGIYYKYKTA